MGKKVYITDGEEGLNGTSNSFPSEVCRSIPLNSSSVDLSIKKQAGQVCNYEHLGKKWKSVDMCSRHGVGLCLHIRKPRKDVFPELKSKDGVPVSDRSWMCPDEKSCWASTMTSTCQINFLKPTSMLMMMGIKCKFAGVQYSSMFNQRKYEALLTDQRQKSGKKEVNNRW